MADFLVDFEWHRDARGFTLVPWNSLIDTNSGERLNRSGDCIVANGGKRIPYRPLDQFDTLYTVFASVKTPRDLLKFINTFGPLTYGGGAEPAPGGPAWGDDVSFSLDQARLFRELLLRQGNPKALAHFFHSELRAAEIRSHNAAYERAEAAAPDTIEADLYWSSIPAAFELTIDVRKGVRLKLRRPRPKNEYDNLLWLSIPIGEIELIPDIDKGVGVRLKLSTDSLLSALWWQLAQKLSGNSMFRQCRHCGTLFEVGLGTNRRADATFCCNQHSVRFHSLRRSTRT
jgi:hypothetical protein